MLYRTKNPHGGDVYENDIILDYSANTNPFGTPEGVLEAIRQALPRVHQYPDPYCRELVKALSEAEGVPDSYLLCGNGAAELIYAYCEALKPTLAMELAPTFSEYALGLQRVGCRVERYALREAADFALDAGLLEALEAQRPQVLFLCSPNNPTGQLIPQALLREILQRCADIGTRVFLDECFMDLADEDRSVKAWLGEFPNLLILKAFTKSYGMAGMRLGYCMSADSGLLGGMAKATQPWNVSTLAQTAGVAALRETEFLKKTRALIPVEREWLRSELTKCGMKVCPSSVNYLLFRGPVALLSALREQGIAIRNCDNYEGLGAGWYRIAVRRREENEQLIAAVRRVCGKE